MKPRKKEFKTKRGTIQLALASSLLGFLCGSQYILFTLSNTSQNSPVSKGGLESGEGAFGNQSFPNPNPGTQRERERERERVGIPVFYNLFVENKKDESRVMDIVSEQKSFFLPEYHKPFYVQSMGDVQLNITNATILGHRPKGNEVITLHSLWEFCKKNPQTEKVVYLHSKGSFHPKPKNTMLRRFLTAGALSEECALVGTQCNVCSTRFSPLPHPHTPGNMWLARCDYIRKLIDPLQFEETMNSIYTAQCRRREKWCVGLGRYSAEHWVHSHPSVKPCDLYNDTGYIWNYEVIPTNGALAKKDLVPAPRFDLIQYIKWPICVLRGISLDQRLGEYRALYGKEPDKSWWGWHFYPSNNNMSFIADFIADVDEADPRGEKARQWLQSQDCWKIVSQNQN